MSVRLLLVFLDVLNMLPNKDIMQYIYNKNVIPLFYDYNTTSSYTDLFAQVQTCVSALRKGTVVQSVAIMFHTPTKFTLKCFDKDSIKATERGDIKHFDSFASFVRTLKIVHQIQDFDIISCDVVPNALGGVLSTLNTGVNINASLNNTGKSGDWNLEYGDVNLIGTYFKSAIVKTKLDLLAWGESIDGPLIIKSSLDYLYTCFGITQVIIQATQRPLYYNLMNIWKIISGIDETVTYLQPKPTTYDATNCALLLKIVNQVIALQNIQQHIDRSIMKDIAPDMLIKVVAVSAYTYNKNPKKMKNLSSWETGEYHMLITNAVSKILSPLSGRDIKQIRNSFIAQLSAISLFMTDNPDMEDNNNAASLIDYIDFYSKARIRVLILITLAVTALCI